MFRFSGIVVHHKERGKQLGFPTANIPVPAEIPDGIYAGLTVVDGQEHISAIFVGKAEQYGETQRFAESHILDFSEDLYGKTIELRLTKKLRESTTFESEEPLIAQIARDVVMVRELFADSRTTPLSSPSRGGTKRGGEAGVSEAGSKSFPPHAEGLATAKGGREDS